MISRIPPQFLYPGMVVGILTMSVLAHVYLIIQASSDGGVDVVPDYYEKAQAWDAEQANAAALRDHRADRPSQTATPKGAE